MGSTFICLTSVGGSLKIDSYQDWCNPTLTNLDGLSNLTSVGGDLDIFHNYNLTNLDGLSNLTSVGGYLRIDWNDSLTNLDGLNALTHMGGNLEIRDNIALTNVDGLSALTTVGDEFVVHYNPILPDCEACDLLDQLTTTPTTIDVDNNFDDTCTPVPANCP